ncbi:hypothetical protein PRECH8_16160 [Insulibacter thermoxylanivorax]|uniref:Uncharacterized protein n=1 Tax=Insulibacter thermoxylanivorax TaxID=2749268 RepID=A0A916QCP5_9BACL|nr:hypothetical protein [Insulibacter thermoxylanivorax]GFR38320.1 hypothetical protein PRECH8_16160 [Insulibacter thermoxylanivorax]
MDQNRNVLDHLERKLTEAKTHFERALDCKHTEFDDLYPYMMEHPQFFWYKRYVAWSELLTIVKLCEELSIDWKDKFTPNQVEYVRNRVMSSKVLDEWYHDSKEHVG